MRPSFESAKMTNKGGREINEDSALFGCEGDAFCWVVADGLGGHGGGDDASRTACETVMRSFQADPAVTTEAVTRHIQRADEAVRQMQLARPALARMRSTVAVLVANSSHAITGHVGDTRVYHLRAGRVLGQTRDHSVPQSLVDAGEISLQQIRNHEDRSRLLRALGEEQPVRPAVTAQPVPIGRGDAFLLCSDGFWENVLETEMELDWAKSRYAADWLAHMQDRLQERVDGSHDNYTAVAVLGDTLIADPISPPIPRAPAQPSSKAAAQPDFARREFAPNPRRRTSRLLLQFAVFLVMPALLLVGAFYSLPPSWKQQVLRLMHAHSRPATGKTAVATTGSHLRWSGLLANLRMPHGDRFRLSTDAAEFEVRHEGSHT